MDDDKLFSKHYSCDTNRYEDKPKFRARILKYTEDFINNNLYHKDIYHACRLKFGISIKNNSIDMVGRCDYPVEKAFGDAEISDILDLVTVVYDSSKNGLKEIGESQKLIIFLESINEIFREESMCYVVNGNGRVRYFPDEEFHKNIKSTLSVLASSKYKNYLERFNDVLDDLYKDHDTELPIRGIFDCVESFIITLVSNKKLNTLNSTLAEKLIELISNKVNNDPLYKEDDKKAINILKDILLGWVSMCHKYRHGKLDQVNNAVPKELFNYIFSTGVSIFRLLLELDNKYIIKVW